MGWLSLYRCRVHRGSSSVFVTIAPPSPFACPPKVVETGMKSGRIGAVPDRFLKESRPTFCRKQPDEGSNRRVIDFEPWS
jgi:hypothetical protein